MIETIEIQIGDQVFVAEMLNKKARANMRRAWNLNAIRKEIVSEFY